MVASVELKEALGNMSKFKVQKVLQNATLCLFGNEVISKLEKDKLTDVFKLLDTNGDGKLSRKELIEGYKKLYNE